MKSDVKASQLNSSKTWLFKLEVIAGLTILAGLISIITAIQAPTATVSALDLSPVTNTVNNTLNKPINNLPAVGQPLANTTDRLLTDTVPTTVRNLTQNVPTPINNTLDRTVETVNAPVERLTNVTQPITDGLGDTVGNVTENLPAPVNNLLDTFQAPVQDLTNTVQNTANTLPAAAETVANTANNVTAPVNNAVNDTLNNPTQLANDTARNFMNNAQNGLRNLSTSSSVPRSTTASPSVPNRTDTHHENTPTTLSEEALVATTAKNASLLTQVGGFFSDLLPENARSFFNRVAETGFDIKPYIVSIAVFLSMIVIIIATTYAEERGKFRFLSDGDGQLAQIARAYDLPQLSLLAFTVLGSGAIVFYILAV